MRLTTVFVRIALSCMALLLALPACSQTHPANPSSSTLATRPADPSDHNFTQWESAIAAFEAHDRDRPPPKGAVLFIGSSTVAMWKTLEQDFPNNRVINRGFGGSEIVDATHFAERIIFPCESRMILLRAGGNDIHAGKSPEQVFADYKAFVAKVHARLPKSKIVFISLNPTPARWSERDADKKVNTLVQRYTRRHPYLRYVETYDLPLTPEGQPRPELFLPDQLHFNAEGYRQLAARVRPVLPK
jgi:lysophospholipase L1-like esterase